MPNYFDSNSISGFGYLNNNAYDLQNAIPSNALSGGSGVVEGVNAVNLGSELEGTSTPSTDPLADFNTIDEGGTATGVIGQGNGASGSWQESSTDSSALTAINTAAGLLGSTANSGSSSSSGNSDSIFSISNWTNLLMRLGVMILGLVFITLGLSMFKDSNNDPVIQVINGAKKTAKAGAEGAEEAAGAA